MYGTESKTASNIPYYFSIFIAVVVGLIAIPAFFLIGMLVFSHTKNFWSGQTTSEKFSKSGYKFKDKKKSGFKNCFNMCCNVEDSERNIQTVVQYNKELEVALKDHKKVADYE